MTTTDRSNPPRWPRLPLQRIVCGTDFSPPAERAAQRAAQLAREHGAVLTLAHVVPASLWDDASTRLAGLFGADMPQADMPQADTLRDEALQRLRQLGSQLEALGAPTCRPEVVFGRPPAELASLAETLDADLLVLADRGGNSLREWMLGTTAQQLLRHSPCPLLVVKRDAALSYRTVLAPTDFSGPSRAALHATAALLPRSVLHIAHAFELPFDGMLRADVSADAKRHYLTQAQRQLTGQLHDLADQLGIAARRDEPQPRDRAAAVQGSSAGQRLCLQPEPAEEVQGPASRRADQERPDGQCSRHHDCQAMGRHATLLPEGC